MSKTLLVPTDCSDLAQRAIPYANGIIDVTGGRIMLLRAVGQEIGSVDEERGELETTADRLKEKGAEVEALLSDSDPAEAILEEARARKADLIVMSTHGRTGLGRWIYGSVAEAVLAGAEAPVLLVSPHAADEWSDPPKRMLIALDGSEPAEAIIEPAGRLAREMGLSVVLLWVIEPPRRIEYAIAGTPFGGGFAYLPPDPREVAESAEPYLEGVAERLRAMGLEVAVRTVPGYAAATIARTAADELADMIALASHGRTGLARTVMGSVASGVVTSATVPVLIVRSGTAQATN